MWPFKPKAWLPPVIAGPVSFPDWTDEQIVAVSKAIRANGQPESPCFQQIARIALNTMADGKAVELVAREIERSLNGGNGERPILGSHYMRGMPAWCMWVEYARPAVAAIAGRRHQQTVRGQK